MASTSAKKTILFISGSQGAGKTAVAEALKAEHGFAHFDGDAWALGADPLGNEGGCERQDPALAEAFKERMSKLTAFLMKFRAEGATPADEPEAYTPFYKAMCADALEAATTLSPHQPGLIVTHAVYRRTMRDFIMQQLGCGGNGGSSGDFAVKFACLVSPPEVASERAAVRCVAQYTGANMSVEEWVALLLPNRAGFQEVSPAEEARGVVTVTNDASLEGLDALLARVEKAIGLEPRTNK